MKSFTQRWREASDEAKDQPMDNDNWTQAEEEISELKQQLVEQTERADRLQAEVEDGQRALQHWDNWLSSVSDNESDDAPWNIAAGEFARLTAELDAVRKSLETQLEELLVRQALVQRVSNERDAAQAKCAELEKGIMGAIDVATGHGEPMPSLWRVEEYLRALLTPTQQAITNPSEAEMLNAERLQFGQPLPAPPEEKRP